MRFTNVRSGCKPTEKEKGIIQPDGSAVNKKSVFSFPRDHRPELRKQMLTVIKGEGNGWNPDHAGICELHLKPEDFVQETYRKTCRKRRVLKSNAVPSAFDCYPK